ncbi:MAG: hypothetical protein WAN14_06610 [Candidatus Acidiferrales bacterium]
MAQILTILPAALLMLSAGKQGLARGLLYAGTLLALLNIATLISGYTALHRM